MANHEHIKWLLEGVDKWNARREQQDFEPDFVGANIYLITHKCQPQLTGDRATEESAQRHERVEEPDQRVGSGG